MAIKKSALWTFLLFVVLSLLLASLYILYSRGYIKFGARNNEDKSYLYEIDNYFPNKSTTGYYIGMENEPSFTFEYFQPVYQGTLEQDGFGYILADYLDRSGEIKSVRILVSYPNFPVPEYTSADSEYYINTVSKVKYIDDKELIVEERETNYLTTDDVDNYLTKGEQFLVSVLYSSPSLGNSNCKIFSDFCLEIEMWESLDPEGYRYQFLDGNGNESFVVVPDFISSKVLSNVE